jgi:hypothetical protein
MPHAGVLLMDTLLMRAQRNAAYVVSRIFRSSLQLPCFAIERACQGLARLNSRLKSQITVKSKYTYNTCMVLTCYMCSRRVTG